MYKRRHLYKSKGPWGTYQSQLTLVIYTIVIMLIVTQAVMAQSYLAGQAFGMASVSGIRGTRTWISANQVPPGYYGIAGLTGICTTTSCSGASVGYWETGWGRGQLTNNNLEMFVSWQVPYGGSGAQYGIASLQGGVGYRYQTLFSNSAQRWEAWLGTTPKFYKYSLGFTSGSRATCGGETLSVIGQNPTPPLNDTCTETQYKTTTNNNWVYHTLTGRQYFGPYCAVNYQPTTLYFWGPVSSCST